MFLVLTVTLSGTAYVHGMSHAKGNFIVLMDADLSHHVSAHEYCYLTCDTVARA